MFIYASWNSLDIFWDRFAQWGNLLLNNLIDKEWKDLNVDSTTSSLLCCVSCKDTDLRFPHKCPINPTPTRKSSSTQPYCITCHFLSPVPRLGIGGALCGYAMAVNVYDELWNIFVKALLALSLLTRQIRVLTEQRPRGPCKCLSFSKVFRSCRRTFPCVRLWRRRGRVFFRRIGMFCTDLVLCIIFVTYSNNAYSAPSILFEKKIEKREEKKD